MKKKLIVLATASGLLATGTIVADEHEGEAEEANVASPMEQFACTYNEGKGPADLDSAVKTWNDWADKQGLDDYSAWTLTPYYATPNQTFDVIWLGGTEKAAALGRAQDTWLATGSKVQAAFDEAISCNVHAAYSVLQIKEPPKRDDPDNIVISFSDCNPTEGNSFDSLYNSMIEWGEYRADNGSKGGAWVFFPSYGGGGEEYAFKWVTAYQNLEDLGSDWDQYSEGGWQKANELFAGKVNCDSSRAYLATNRRRAEDEE